MVTHVKGELNCKVAKGSNLNVKLRRDLKGVQINIIVVIIDLTCGGIFLNKTKHDGSALALFSPARTIGCLLYSNTYSWSLAQ